MPAKTPVLSSPYRDSAVQWLRGNLHTHTTESDGELSPAETAAAYRSRGYDFVALSDHDLITRLDPAGGAAPLLIPAVEVGGGPHVLCVGVRDPIDARQGRQHVIGAAVAQGGLAVLNHPNWGSRFVHWRQEDLEALDGYAGIEVMNGVIDRLEGSSLATDRWDMLLSAGRRVWGFAHDDMHLRQDLAHAWLMVDADEVSGPGVLAALSGGRFYGSTGVGIEAVLTDGEKVGVVAPEAGLIRFVSRHGVVRSEAVGPEAWYACRGDEGYVRVECCGAAGAMAWSQPVLVTGG